MKRKLLLLLLCVVFLGLALYGGLPMYRAWRETRTLQQRYEALYQYVSLEPGSENEAMLLTHKSDQSTPAQETIPEGTQPAQVLPVVDFEALQAINPDIVAWICLEGTQINYPVVQGADNSQYLHTLYDGSYNAAGSIFMDYRNQEDLTDRHTVLYGHHMKNDSMFAQITEYKNQAFYEEHPVCLILTPEGNYRLEFFAGFVTDMNSQAWKLEFGSDQEFDLWLEDAVSRSTFTGTVTPTAQDRIVTFSTCTYEYADARYVLLGRLSQI